MAESLFEWNGEKIGPLPESSKKLIEMLDRMFDDVSPIGLNNSIDSHPRLAMLAGQRSIIKFLKLWRDNQLPRVQEVDTSELSEGE